MKIKKSIMSFLLVLCLMIPCFFVLTSCGKNNEVVETGYQVLYKNEDITTKSKTVYFDYDATDLVESHIVVKAVFSDGTTKVISKKTADQDGYEITNNVPETRVPETEYSFVISYKEYENVVIKVKFNKQNLAKPVLTETSTGFSWTAVAHATGYEYQVSTNGTAWGETWTQTSELSVTLNWGETIRVRAITTEATFKEASDFVVSNAWRPERTKVTVPAIHSSSRNLTYTVENINGALTEKVYKLVLNGNFDETLMTYDDSQSGVEQNLRTTGKVGGSWTFTISLKNTNKYTWADGSTAPKTFTWTIANVKLNVPRVNTLTYNGASQTVDVSYVDGIYVSYVEDRGTRTETNAGTYSFYVKRNYLAYTEWYDGNENEEREIQWTINKLPLGEVTVTDEKTGVSWTAVENANAYAYQIRPQTGEWGAVQTTTDLTLTLNYGDTVRIKAINTANENYEEGMFTEHAWTPVRTVLTSPTIAASSLNLVFEANDSGEVLKLLTLDNFDDSTMTISNASLLTTGIACGTVGFTISVKDTIQNCFEGNRTTLEYTWTIAKKTLTNPTFEGDTFEYDTTEKSVTVTGFDSIYMQYVSGFNSLSATNVGNYTIKIERKYANYTVWETEVSDNTIVHEWAITAKTVEKPTRAFERKNYTGSALTIVNITAETKELVNMTPNTESQTNAGEYTYTISLKDKANYTWADGTTDDITFTATIDKVKLMAPAIVDAQRGFSWAAVENATGYEYQISTDGTTWGETWTKTTETTVTLTRGQFVRVRAINEDTNYITSEIAVSRAFIPVQTELALPTIAEESQNLTFEVNSDGAVARKLVLNGYDTTKMKISSDAEDLLTTGMVGGTKMFTFTILDTEYYCFEGGATTSSVYTWTINPRALTNPTLTISEFTYNGSEQTTAVTGFDSTYMEYVSGFDSLSATNVGNYTVKIARKYAEYTTWATPIETVDVELTFSIVGIKIAKPTATGESFDYTGSEIKLINISAETKAGVEDAAYAESQTAAGTYVYEYRLKTGYEWDDGTTESVSIVVTINKVLLDNPSNVATHIVADKNLTTNEVLALLPENERDLYVIYDENSNPSYSAQNAMMLPINVKLKDSANYAWKFEDENQTDQTIRTLSLYILKEGIFKSLKLNDQDITDVELATMQCVKAGSVLTFELNEGFSLMVNNEAINSPYTLEYKMMNNNYSFTYNYNDGNEKIGDFANIYTYIARTVTIDETEYLFKANSLEYNLQKDQTTITLSASEDGLYYMNYTTGEYIAIPTSPITVNVENIQNLSLYFMNGENYEYYNDIQINHFSIVESIEATIYDIEKDTILKETYNQAEYSGIGLNIDVKFKKGETGTWALSTTSDGSANEFTDIAEVYSNVYLLIRQGEGVDITEVYDLYFNSSLVDKLIDMKSGVQFENNLFNEYTYVETNKKDVTLDLSSKTKIESASWTINGTHGAYTLASASDEIGVTEKTVEIMFVLNDAENGVNNFTVNQSIKFLVNTSVSLDSIVSGIVVKTNETDSTNLEITSSNTTNYVDFSTINAMKTYAATEGVTDAITATLVEGYTQKSAEYVMTGSGMCLIKLVATRTEDSTDETIYIVVRSHALLDGNTNASLYSYESSGKNVYQPNEEGVYTISINSYDNIYIETESEYATIKFGKQGETLAVVENRRELPIDTTSESAIYTLEITASNGTIKTYTLNISVTQVPTVSSLFQFTVGGHTVTMLSDATGEFIMNGSGESPTSFEAYLALSDAQIASLKQVENEKTNILLTINNSMFGIFATTEKTEALADDVKIEVTTNYGKECLVVYIEIGNKLVPIYLYLGNVATLTIGNETFKTTLTMNMVMNGATNVGDVVIDQNSGSATLEVADATVTEMTITLDRNFSDCSYYVVAGADNIAKFQAIMQKSSNQNLLLSDVENAGVSVIKPNTTGVTVPLTFVDGSCNMLVVVQGAGDNMYYALPLSLVAKI